MKGLDLSKFKKTAEDKDTATMIHKDGHTLVIAKGSLPALHKKQLEALPIHKEDGKAHYDDGTGSVQSEDMGANSTPAPATAQPWEAPNAQASAPAPTATAPADIAGPAPASVDAAPAQTQGETMQTPLTAKIPGYEEEKLANIEAAGAIGAQGAEEAAATQSAGEALAKMPTQADIVNANKAASDKLFAAYQAKELDPDHYWQNHSKIAAGIGMLLAGGAGTDNGAYQAMQKGIDRDIDLQKAGQEKGLNLWKMNRQMLGSDLEADLATKNQLYTGLKYKLAQAAATAQGPIALAKAHAANAQIDQAIGMNSFKMSLMNPSSDNPDPATRVQFLVPPERQQKVFDEIDAAKNTVANAPGILEAFDQAAKEVRPLSGGTGTSMTAFVPGMKSAGQSALVARLGPTFKDVEGTVRQAAMDNMEKNTEPAFGDSDARIASRRASLIQYLRSKEAASTAKGFGIDLSRFPSTRGANIGNGASGSFARGQEQGVSKSGKPMIKVNGEWHYK